MPIQKLPQYLINKLKAGEIIERPASIVKELLENALDANPTQITITIKNGGVNLISVTDDGEGIAPDDIPLTIERHATSKITTEDDIWSLTSYGFRGEALASIAEVSAFSLISKTADQPVATSITKDGAAVTIGHEPFVHEHGTAVHVKSLFASLPARRKFVRSARTEWRYIRAIIIQYMLRYPDIARTVSHNDKTIYTLTSAPDILTRISEIYDDETIAHLIPVSYGDQLRIEGVISDSKLTYGHRDNIHIFVNNRPITDNIITKAIMQSYARHIPPRTYPFVCLFVTIPDDQVDVNVHPRKTQVTFADPQSIFALTQQACTQAFGSHKTATLTTTIPKTNNHHTPSTHLSPGQHAHPRQDANPPPLRTPAPTAPSTQTTQIGSARDSPPLTIDGDPITIIGQLRNMYICCTGREHCYMIDQHAVAERVLFERLRHRYRETIGQTHILLTPLHLTRPPHRDHEEDEIIQQYNALGFDITLFDEQTIAVYAIPSCLATQRDSTEGGIDQLIDLRTLFASTSTHDTVSIETLLDDIFATRSCKMAVKAGDPLSYEQMHRLIYDATHEITGLFVCQHGRTAIVKLPKSDIDKRFLR